MKTLMKNLRDLNTKILEGNALTGFEKYYDDSVVMQENETAPTVGKTADGIRENEVFKAITEFRGAIILSVTAGESTTLWSGILNTRTQSLWTRATTNRKGSRVYGWYMV